MTLETVDLIAGIRNSDDRTIRYVFEQYGPKVVGYVVNNSGTEEEGHDILQQTIMKVWQNIRDDKYKDAGKFDSYFYRIAANTWLEVLRKRKKAGVRRLSEREYEIADGSTAEEELAFVRDARHQALYRGLHQLGEICQKLLKQFHFEQVPLKDLAINMQMEYGSLRKRIYDCRKRLRKLVEAELQTESI